MGIRNIRDVQRGHASVLHFTEKFLAESLVAAGIEARQHVFRYPGFKPRTGKLQGATGYKVVRGTSSGRILKIFNTAKYAPFVEYGTRAHGPVHAKFLRFRIGARLVFAKRVRGIRAYRFLYNATDAAFRVGGRFMRDSMSKIASRF